MRTQHPHQVILACRTRPRPPERTTRRVPRPQVMRQPVAPSVRRMLNSPYQLPPPTHGGGAQRSALSRSSKSRRRTNWGNSRACHNRRRASGFKRSDTNLRCIDLIDNYGSITWDETPGSMEIIRHESVLEACRIARIVFGI